VMPPFISSDENLIQLMAAIFSVLEP